jgi:hypothetical protein
LHVVHCYLWSFLNLTEQFIELINTWAAHMFNVILKVINLFQWMYPGVPLPPVNLGANLHPGSINLNPVCAALPKIRLPIARGPNGLLDGCLAPEAQNPQLNLPKLRTYEIQLLNRYKHITAVARSIVRNSDKQRRRSNAPK